MIYTLEYTSPVGRIMIGAKEDALAGLWIENQKYYIGSVKEEMEKCQDLPVLIQAKKWLDRYFAGERPKIRELKLAPSGSEFQKKVWKLLMEIPYGQVTTYGELSRRIAREQGIERMSAQAVGGAVGHNPISIIIPCHRVVGSNGSLTGYAGGIEKKIALLEHEGVSMEKFFVPKKGTAL
ncbi:methylated-DNA--[protein]-cysteine S-methyltransferase [Blautia producta]|uniref:methylated-DNA--[protein]-cysteine S-methyltransferase n=1 Tax=Blautia producta TaxID=33035 RepID=UPI0031B5AE1A